MRASENRLVFGTIALFVSIVAIGFVYAGFTGTLNINGTGSVTASKWDIYFANLSNAITTGNANVIEPATIKTKTSIGDYLVELSGLGDGVSYTFDVVNDGSFDAYLTSLIITPPQCSGGDATSNEVGCNNLEYTLKYTSNNEPVKENDPLFKGQTKNMTLKLQVKSNGNLTGVTRDVTISGLGILMIYSQASGYNGAESIADEVTSPTIGLSNNEEVQLVTPGTSTFDVDYYEYYFSTSSEEPAISATATGTTNGTISVSNYSKIEYPQFYIWYRTVSTHGNKSAWSNRLLVSQKFTVTLDANGGTIPTTSGWTNGSGNSTATKTIRYGNQYENLPTPTQNDCYFSGWEGNILDVYDLTEAAKSRDIDINSSGYVYDKTPTTDNRNLNPHDDQGYNRSNWFIDITPRQYDFVLNMIQIATLTHDNKTGSSFVVDPYVTISSGPLIENNYLNKSLLNKNGATKTFIIGENKTLGIALKVLNGVADVKLVTLLTNSDKYNLRYNATLTAKWQCSIAASVNGVRYDTLQDAINNGVPNNGSKTLITILRDIDDENITIPASKNVELDINGYTISNDSGVIFENKGTLEIKNGSIIRTGKNDTKRTIINTGNLTITSGEIKHDSYNAIQNKGTMTMTGGKIWLGNIADQGVINNESGALISISGGQIIGTYRQALYNNGGTVNISGNAFLKNGYDDELGYLSNKPTRSCLQNASGTMNITGGTIITPSNNSNYAAVENNGTMTIGNNNGVIDTTTPVIRGNYYGLIIKNNKTVSYYDGIIGGLNAAVNVESRLVLDATNNVGLNYGTETIGSDTYNTITLTEQSGN